MGHAHDQEASPESMTAEFPREPESVTRARKSAIDSAATWGMPPSVVERLALVVTELASNAIVHAESPFELRLHHIDGVIRGQIHDTAAEPPRVLRPAPRATAGRGVMIVRQLTDRAGVESTTAGKSVWFELDVAP